MLRDIVDRAIVTRFYPPSGYNHHKLLLLDQFHNYTYCKRPSNYNTKKNLMQKMSCNNCAVKSV